MSIFLRISLALTICLEMLHSQVRAEDAIPSFQRLIPLSEMDGYAPVEIVADDFSRQNTPHASNEEEMPLVSDVRGTLLQPSSEESVTAASNSFLDEQVGIEDPAHNENPHLQTSYTDEFAVLDESEVKDKRTLPARPSSCLECVSERVTPWIKWKSTSVAATVLPGKDNRLGITEFKLKGKMGLFGVPFLTASPRYEMTFLTGPLQTDLPETLHRASVSFMGMMPLNKKWLAQVVVNPGFSSDFRNTSSDGLRITGHALAIYMPSPEYQWMFGVVYLDREDVSLLPAVGLTWSPTEDRKVELVFPRPKILQRIAKQGENERWAYLAAEFGGGSWAIERANGTDDVVTIRDYRLMCGMEYKRPDDRELFWETGIVFGRNIEYTSGIGDYSQDPTVILRAGSTF